MTHFQIYGLRDSPEIEYPDPHVRYIGKSNDPLRRIKEHCVKALEAVIEWEQECLERLHEEAAQPEMPAPFTSWLGNHWREGHLPEVVILEVASHDVVDWRQREQYWIMFAKKLGLELYNQTRGG